MTVRNPFTAPKTFTLLLQYTIYFVCVYVCPFRMAYRWNYDDEEEAARERRRRARQERMRSKEGEEVSNPAEGTGLNSHGYFTHTHCS